LINVIRINVSEFLRPGMMYEKIKADYNIPTSRAVKILMMNGVTVKAPPQTSQLKVLVLVFESFMSHLRLFFFIP